MKDSVLYCCSQCPSGPSVCQERNYFNLQKCAQLKKKKKRKENKSLKTEMLNAKEIKHGLPHCNTLGGFPITAGLIQSESQALLKKTAHLPFIWVREVCLGCSGADRWGCRRRGKKSSWLWQKTWNGINLGEMQPTITSRWPITYADDQTRRHECTKTQWSVTWCLTCRLSVWPRAPVQNKLVPSWK